MRSTTQLCKEIPMLKKTLIGLAIAAGLSALGNFIFKHTVEAS